MSGSQDRPSGCVLASKPSASFSSISSAASATSAGSARSGGSKLLFGEIDLSSERSTESYASVCSFVLCDSSTFLRFWLEDACRDVLFSHLSGADLASLRLACHDFSVRAAPALFSDLAITFKAATFTKPARLAALDRLGFYVKSLTFNIPHSPDTLLPPLVDPGSGAELTFTYTPHAKPSSVRQPKYNDIGTTEILTRQWPPLFHAATNVPAFIRAFSSLVNLSSLTVSCPGFDHTQRYRRSIVDFALISLRIAVERNSLNALEHLTLSPIHPGGLLHLSPVLAYGASPRSASRWARIKHLAITVDTIPPPPEGERSDFKLLQTYLRNFQSNLASFKFSWTGQKGPLPVQQPLISTRSLVGDHPATVRGTQPHQRRRAGPPLLHFAKLQNIHFDNIQAPASHISAFLESHKASILDLTFDDTHLSSGTWDDALAPLVRLVHPQPNDDGRSSADIPIMLSPSTAGGPTNAPPAAPRAPIELVELELATPHNPSSCPSAARKSLRMSARLLPATASSSSRHKTRTPTAAQKVRDGLLEAEEQLRKVLRSSMFARR